MSASKTRQRAENIGLGIFFFLLFYPNNSIYRILVPQFGKSHHIPPYGPNRVKVGSAMLRFYLSHNHKHFNGYIDNQI